MLNDKSVLLSLWYKVLKTRLLEEKIIELYPEKEMRCPVHLSIGQEGIAAGVCQALSDEDMVFSGHRAHAHYISKNGDIKAMLAEIYGKQTGCCGGRGGSMHLIDKKVNFVASTPIVGSTIPIAAGAAFSSKFNKKENIVVLFIGEAAVEEGIFHETMNFASLKKLPLLVICENNLYSVYTPLKDRQPDREIYKIAQAHGIESFKADGNNPLEVYESVKKAKSLIKSGNGPFFIEFSTYRWREHCGINYDNNIGYRTEAEFQEWKQKDPVEKLKKDILSSNLASIDELQKIQNKIKQEIQEAVDFAKQSPFPDPKTISDNIYSK